MDTVNEVFRWVVSNGYASVADWAADSDYRRVGRDRWFDEDGHEVDIWECALGAMRAATVERREWRERRHVLVGKVNTCPVCDAINVVEVKHEAHHGSVILVCRSCTVCDSAWTDEYHLAACSLDSVEDVEAVRS